MTPPPQERGAALVVTLVFVAAMAAAAVAFVAGRRSDALALRGQLQAIETDALLEAALSQTVALLANRTPQQRVPDQLTWSFGDAAVRVRLEPEAGKVDLNQAEIPLLRALPMALGLEEEEAARLADAIQDWRDDDQRKSRLGAEDPDYGRGTTGTSGAADRPFAHPAELRYVRGMDRQLWGRLEPYVTIYAGTAEPDPRAAAGPVRAALQLARKLQRDTSDRPDDRGEREGRGELGRDGNARAGSDDGRDASSAGVVGRDRSFSEREEAAVPPGEDADASALPESGGAGEEGGARTVLLDVRFANGYEAAAKAVIALMPDAESGPPYMVLSWAPVLRGAGAGS